MFSLLKSDLYRLAHGKMLWVALLVSAAVTATSCGLLWFSTTPQFAHMVNDQIELADEKAEFDDEELQALNESTTESLTYVTAQMTWSGGFITIVTALLAALLCAQDFTSRFAQSIFSTRYGRTAYYAEKLLVIAFLCAVVVVANLAFAGIGMAAAGFTYTRAETVIDALTWTALAWLVAFAYAAITACIMWLTRSKGAAIACALLLASTIIESLLSLALTMIPPLSQLSCFLPAHSVALLSNGSAGLLAAGDELPVTALSPAAWVVLVTAVVLAATFAVVFAACKRKDV